ncbi:PAS domain-containing sensor histidine kinase [Spirosoma pulveris]
MIDITNLHDEVIFQTIVMESPIPIALLVGRDLIITVANKPQLTVWGKGDAVFGLPLAKAIPEMEGQPFLDILDNVFTSGVTFSTNNTPANMVRNGVSETVYFDFSFKAIRNQQGAVFGIIATGIDITQQVATHQALQHSEERYRQLAADLDRQVQERTLELEDSVQELTRSNENLQQFAFIASHDLQEPLRKVQQFGSLVRNQYSHLLGEGIDYIDRMQSAASRMSTLIRDLLSYSRISTQQDKRSLVSLKTVLQTVLGDLEMTAIQTKAIIELGNLPTLEGDPSQLELLFTNLLSNALKFHPPGIAPRIRVESQWVDAAMLPKSVRATGRALAYHRVDVMDNGIGFDEKYLDRIFQVFQRLHGKNEYAGTGIGLAICQKVVANHGGIITAYSQPGVGSTFSVYLPVSL